MAKIEFRRVDRNATREDIIKYLNYLVDELEFILQNLDEENIREED